MALTTNLSGALLRGLVNVNPGLYRARPASRARQREIETSERHEGDQDHNRQQQQGSAHDGPAVSL